MQPGHQMNTIWRINLARSSLRAATKKRNPTRVFQSKDRARHSCIRELRRLPMILLCN